MKVLGITGSIATGKSTVTNYLKQRGYLVVDSDKLAYDALTIDEVCIKQTKNRFDLPAGPIDRKALGRIIFNDKQAKKGFGSNNSSLCNQENARNNCA